MRPIVLCLALAATLALPASAAADSTPSAGRPQCIGLVLGGGGARGAAHIGVLKVLERERVPVCRIAGTSMGAIVGGLYASGYSADEIEAILSAVDWKEVLADDPPRTDFPLRRKNDTLRYLLDFKFGLRDGAIQLPRGVIQGQKLLTLLRRLTIHTWRTPDFDALPIPFRAVATDIGTGEAVVFSQGDLALAIRGSMSVPAAFAPLRIDGRLLVDGGIVNNVPVDVVKAMGADRVIAVDVGAPLLDDSELNSPFAITMQMLDVLMKQRTAQVMAAMDPRDVKIVPDLGDIGSASFDRAVDAIAPGEVAAIRVLPRLRELSLGEAEWAALQATRERVQFDAPLVEFLEVVTRRSKTAGYVKRELEGFEGKPLDPMALERRVNSVYGQGNYEHISWKLVEKEGRTGVEVLPVDKGWGPNFLTFGLQVSDDFEGRNSYQLGAEYTMTGLNRWGGEWRTRAEIGRITGLRTEFFQPAGDRGQFFGFPYLEYRAINQDIRVGDTVLADYRVRRGAVGIDVGWEPNVAMRAYAGLFRSRGDASRQIGTPGDLDDVDESSGGVRLGFTRDTLDDADFPSAGGRTDLLLLALRDVLGDASEGEIVDLTWDHATSFGPNRLLFGTRLQARWGRPSRFESPATLGGFTNLSGYSERELIGDHAALFRTVYYRRLGDAGELFSVPAYVGASLETGNVFLRREDLLDLEDLVLGGSLFVGVDSPFGPLFLGYGRNDQGDASVYLTFGSLLRPRL
ncbi:MAG: patatin-like phospholipase family protein [Xanthomonadaceae bacterium]|jgi:NTE family protein|nr:patatin-like phospholipase family protein [Xanthomonadaceae bacterium]